MAMKTGVEESFDLFPEHRQRLSARDEALAARGIRIPRPTGAPRPRIEGRARPAWLAFLLRLFG